MRQPVSISILLCSYLLTLLASSVSAQSIPRAEADSLLKVLAVSKSDTNRVRVWLRLGEHQVYKPGEFKADMDSARTYAEQAQDLSRTLDYHEGEAESLNLTGTISRESKNLLKSIYHHKQAINLSKRQKDVKGEAAGYLLLAHAWRDKGDAREARTVVQKAIDLYVSRGYSQLAAHAYIELGNTYANQGEELNEKIKFYQQALEVFRQAGNKRRQADLLKDLGDLYQLQGNNAKAPIELRQSLVLYQSITYRQLQGLYDLLGNVSSQRGDYKKGIQYGLQAIKTAEELKDSTLQVCTIYCPRGE